MSWGKHNEEREYDELVNWEARLGREDIRWGVDSAVAQIGALGGPVAMLARFCDLVVLSACETAAGTSRRGEDVAPDLSPDPGGPEKDLRRWEIRRRLEEGLVGLSDVRREVLLLHDLEGWKHREIGEKLGIPDGTVRSHLHFARRHLKDHLERFLGRTPSGEER